MRGTSLLFGLFGGALLCGCGDDSGGSAGGGQMYTTRSSVSDGLAAAGDVFVAAGQGVFGVFGGSGAHQIRDGWSVEYQKLLVSLGTVTLRRTDDGDHEVVARVIVDLQGVPDDGVLIDHVDGRGGPASVDFTLPPATTDSAALAPGTLEADAEMMIKNGWAFYIEGTIEKSDGHSCKPDAPADCVQASTIRFRWGLPHGAAYTGCEWNDPSVPSQNVTLTLPAVTWLQTSVDTETTTMRAQWIADADLDRDGETTLEELEQIDAAVLLTRRRGYDLSGTSRPIDTVYDYLREQVLVAGMRSWGRCTSASEL
ncbi:hypothetical protein [Nannocystis sp. SCPEA4]|uniref:hypothetical protein n=1 Tax=Nannocystis sp. SCPEA4 TaxID=2996787 RepID=UPI00226D70D0|nr:hypothetical protein [Nannocystis sp. SCPEA4]MCY1054849.1 hypothetical protein [Nannocystis sp. SCPEA4]